MVVSTEQLFFFLNDFREFEKGAKKEKYLKLKNGFISRHRFPDLPYLNNRTNGFFCQLNFDKNRGDIYERERLNLLTEAQKSDNLFFMVKVEICAAL